MIITDRLDNALDAYHGDDLQGATIGFDDWDAFCAENDLTPVPTEFGQDVEVLYRGVRIQPGVTPDRITLITGD